MIEAFSGLFRASQQLCLVDNDVFKMLTSAFIFHHICISHNFLTSCTSDLLNNSPSLWWGEREKKKDGAAYLFSGLQWVELTKMMWHNLSPAITNQWALRMLGHIPSGFTFLKVQQVLQCVIKGLFQCQEMWGTCDDSNAPDWLERRRDKAPTVTLSWSILTCVTFRNN